MNQMRVALIATIMGSMYGGGVYMTMDSFLTLMYMENMRELFDPCRFFFAPLLASYGCLYGAHTLFEDTFYNRQFDWKLSLKSFLVIGFCYSTIFVYPTELVCGVQKYGMDRLLLAAPSTILFMSLLETMHVHERFREAILSQADDRVR